MTRMVVGNYRLRQREPRVAALSHALRRGDLFNGCAHIRRLLLRQMLAEESENLAPAIHGLFGSVERPVPVEEAMAGTFVAVELVALAMLFELGFMLVHLLGARRAVVAPKNADQGAGEIIRQVDRCN